MCQPTLTFTAMYQKVIFLFTVLAGLVSMEHLDYVLDEELPIGTIIADLREDLSMVATLTQSQQDQLRFRFLNPNYLFEVDASSGIISQIGRLDRDAICPGLSLCDLKIDIVILPVQFFAVVSVTIHLEDVNDTAPVFTQSRYVMDGPEDLPVGTMVSA